ncbi:MAG: hypothetical protein A4E61_01938 [Syntrophorhabdus sp. PtaB.Bin184]|jgi:hypothetical protein|nr:MAG: hypothetical protein A4E61_01938 [Syntrophorhabdus sp. PtaB.Bin184]
MTISDYQISSVIRTYMKNMKVRMNRSGGEREMDSREDEVNISREGMKKMLYDRIGEHVTEKLKRHDEK